MNGMKAKSTDLSKRVPSSLYLKGRVDSSDRGSRRSSKLEIGLGLRKDWGEAIAEGDNNMVMATRRKLGRSTRKLGRCTQSQTLLVVFFVLVITSVIQLKSATSVISLYSHYEDYHTNTVPSGGSRGHIDIDHREQTSPARTPSHMHKQGQNVEEEFFWEADPHNCHAVDNICYANNLKRWFYFQQEGEQRTTNIYQPSFALENVHIMQHVDVSSVTVKPTLSQLNLSDRCTLSNVDNHVVLQTAYNDMIGEFYGRTLRPMSMMMKKYPPDPNNLQFYVHMMKGSGKLYDAHDLFLGAFSNNKAMSWLDMFTKNDDIMENHTSCQCYRRFVMCGYTTVENNNTKCEMAFGNLELPNVAQTLCQHGIELNLMSKMEEVQLDGILSNINVTKNVTTREKVKQYVRKTPLNVALKQPSKASSVLGTLSPRNAFDGIIGTRWASEALDNQTLTVDLESVHDIQKVVVVWEHASAKEYSIQVSNDEIQWETVWKSVPDRTGEGAVESVLTNVIGRYIRMQGIQRSTKW